MSGGKWCYPGTEVLINKYDLRDRELLEEFEIQKFTVEQMSLMLHPDKIKSTCDEEHLVSLNKLLFGDIYEWAGTYREENMYKSERVLSGGSAEYSDHKKIPGHLDRFFRKYNAVEWSDQKNLTDNATNFFVELWSIHPFREGNTRSCTTYMWHYLREKGVEIDLELFKNNPGYVRDALVMANYGEFQYLRKIVAGALDQEERLPLERAIEAAQETYQISKEEYRAFKEKYDIKETKERG